MCRAHDDHEFLAIYVCEWNRFFNMTNILPLAFRVIKNNKCFLSFFFRLWTKIIRIKLVMAMSQRKTVVSSQNHQEK